MTPWRSFEILELPGDATLDDARRAYKDMATVWHPDRFAANPRLKQKAEQKLKELNIAYEAVRTFLQQAETPTGIPKEKGSPSRPADGLSFGNKEEKDRPRSRTEFAAEAGTVLVLNVCSYFSKKIKHYMR